mmetsp:Transcript_565/g.827  ORF Transcript_565/g.827 Transcript_565/m.827 type:complete len:96 (-) Transcript_565:352-639(-)
MDLWFIPARKGGGGELRLRAADEISVPTETAPLQEGNENVHLSAADFVNLFLPLDAIAAIGEIHNYCMEAIASSTLRLQTGHFLDRRSHLSMHFL